MPIIPPRSGHALLMEKGQTLRVLDVEGCQVADFVCFNEGDPSEFFSQANTRAAHGRVRISTGDVLYSNLYNVMFEIVGDTVGVHDLLFPPCNKFINECILGEGPRPGCLENLAAALQPHGIPKGNVPNPFNIFMHTGVDADNRMFIRRPLSKPNDYIDLKAQMDCLVAVSACAGERDECNGDACTSISVEIL